MASASLLPSRYAKTLSLQVFSGQADLTSQAINAAVPLGTAYESNGALLADSEVYDWTYKLDPSAPLLYTRDDILAKAADFDGKARVGKSAPR